MESLSQLLGPATEAEAATGNTEMHGNGRVPITRYVQTRAMATGCGSPTPTREERLSPIAWV